MSYHEHIAHENAVFEHNLGAPGAPDADDWGAPRTDASSSRNGGFDVNQRLTPKRQIENPEYAGMVRRVMKALARRVAEGDIESLTELTGLAAYLDGLTRDTVVALRDQHGYSWGEVGRACGVTKQGAQQRWASKVATGSEEDK